MIDLGKKKRILLVNEFSGLRTGFSKYGLEVMRRLHKTGKFELAEMASYINPSNYAKQAQYIPWKVYPVMPEENDNDAINAYNADPLNQFGKGMFEDVLIDFMPDVVCFPSGNNILTQNGLVDISNIKENDKVLSINGKYKPVIATMKNEYSGDLINIHTRFFNQKITCTPNHPFLVNKKENRYINKSKWINASDLQKGDFLLFPIEQFATNNEYFMEYKHVDIFKLGKIMGYITSEGYISDKDNTISCSFGIKEDKFASELCDMVHSIFGYMPHKRIEEKEIKVSIHNVKIIRFIKKYIVKNKSPKRIIIPKISDCSKEFWKGFLNGFFNGDCSVTTTYNKFTSIKATSFSYNLIFKIYTVMLSFGVIGSISKNKLSKKAFSSKNEFCYHITVNCSYEIEQFYQNIGIDKKNIIPNISKKKRRMAWIEDKWLFYPIKNVSKTPYDGLVYNMEVKNDPVYVAGCAIVHNCDIRDH